LVFRRDGVVPQGNVAHHEGDRQVATARLIVCIVFTVFAVPSASATVMQPAHP